jgi:hypothetical protein
VKRYLLDTGIVSDFINHRKGVDVKAREARPCGARLGTCMPVVGGLFFPDRGDCPEPRQLHGGERRQ